MNVMKKLKSTLTLICSLTLVGCFDSTFSNSSVDRWIDNPTANEIKVTIDDKELTIPAKSGIKYAFEYGKHTLKYNGDSLTFMAKPAISNNTGFINPTQSNYILLTTFYTNSDKVYEEMIKPYLKIIQVSVNGEPAEMELPVKIINDVFIEKNGNSWDYSVDEELPDSVTVRGENQYQAHKRKMYRESDFLDTINSEDIDEKVSLPYTPKKFSEIKKYVLPTIDLDKIECQEGREFLASQLQDWNKFFTTKGSESGNTYKQLTSHETFKKKHSLCSGQDPNHTYQMATREIEDVMDGLRQINFYVTE